MECKDCIHYLRHYVKMNDRFQPIDGHCTNETPDGNFRSTDKICEHFAQRDLKLERERQIGNVTECLYYIARRLDELLQLIENLPYEEPAKD